MALPNRGGSESPSRTMRLANLVNIGRRNGSERKDRNDNERERERERLSVSPSAPKTLALPYPSPYVTVSNSVSSPSVISRSRGNSGNSLQLRPPDDSTNYNQLYYQAQVAHLQTALVKEHALVVRVSIGFSILVFIMLLVILFLLGRPANCDHVGHRFHIPVFSPWSSAHEKEQYTSSGWSITTVAFLTTLGILAWQNRNAIGIPLIRFLTSHFSEIQRYLTR